MSPEPTTADELTRKLIAGQGAPLEQPAARAAAAHEAFERVSAEFCRWVGTRGYEALVSRALAESRQIHPPLREMQFQTRSASYLSGVTESIDRHGAAETSQALAALIEAILALLSRLIGDDIVVTLVTMTLKNGRQSGNDSARNLDQRSTTP